jgi:hypothetical protein
MHSIASTRSRTNMSASTGPPRTEAQYSKPAETAWSYPARPGDAPLTRWTFSWNVFADSETVFRDGARPGVPRLAAGVRAEWGTLQDLEPARQNALGDAGFEAFTKGDLKSAGWDWVWRLAYAEDVIAGASL